MSGGLQVVPAELHVSASLVDGHAGAVQAGHGAADSELAAAQAALAGSGGPTPRSARHHSPAGHARLPGARMMTMGATTTAGEAR